jgi:hypothetical protein
MKIVFALLIAVTGLAVYYFQKIESYLIDANYSWLISKAFPYLLLIILGIVLYIVFRKAFKTKRKLVNFIFGFIFITTPFLAGFLLNPIFEGDFSNSSDKVKDFKVYDEFIDAQLVVVSIPGCPYCMGSIDLQKKMIQRIQNSKSIL